MPYGAETARVGVAMLRTRNILSRSAGVAQAIRPVVAVQSGSRRTIGGFFPGFVSKFQATPYRLVGLMTSLGSREEHTAPVETSTTQYDPEVVKVANAILALNMRQVMEMSKWLKKELGVGDMPVGVAVAAPAAAAAAPAAAAEKTSFTLKLDSFGTEKIKVIKEVRAITDLALKEAKALVESAPCELKAGLSKEDAEKFKAAIEACAGAKTSLE